MIASLGKSRRISFIDILIALVLAGLLYYGASWQYLKTTYDDAGHYQCYTQAFWGGTASLNTIEPNDCSFLRHPNPQIMPITHDKLVNTLRSMGLPSPIVNFVDAQVPSQPFHALPYEYPMLTLIPFTLSLIAPASWFQVAYAFWMIVVALSIYFALLRYKSRTAAVAFTLLIVIGGWGTVAGRFDIIPAAFSLFAVICADRKRWNWAFAFLALAVLYKYYPVMLLIPFLIVQQREAQGSWKAWKRWEPLGVFVIFCAVVMGISMLLSVQGTISPFTYLGGRPVQVESLAASLLWVGNHILGNPVHYEFTFGSLNIVAFGENTVSKLMTVAEAVSILYTCWLVWRRKLDLATSSLLIVTLLIVTGKVFSPQYLIWLIPLVAYVGGTRLNWVLVWAAIGLLTTWIYPFIYNMKGLMGVPHVVYFFPATTTRNFLMLAFVIGVFYVATRYGLKQATTEVTEKPEPENAMNVSVDALNIQSNQ